MRRPSATFLARFRHEKDEVKGQEPRRLRKLRQVIEAIQQASLLRCCRGAGAR